MEAPKALAVKDEHNWIFKEPVLVTWKDPDQGEIVSLGQPCPRNGRTQLTLWIGEQVSKKSLVVMLQLTIIRRVSERRKAFDLFLMLPPGSCCDKEPSVVMIDDTPQDVRHSLMDGYGESSVKRCLHVTFRQNDRSRVLMNIHPEKAKPIDGTPLHLMMLFRSLSTTRMFDVYIGYSDYARQPLSRLDTRLANVVYTPEIDIPRAYGGKGGTFDEWNQYNVEKFKDIPESRHLPPGKEDVLQSVQKITDTAECILQDSRSAHGMNPSPLPPPYYSSAVQATASCTAQGFSPASPDKVDELQPAHAAGQIRPRHTAPNTLKRPSGRLGGKQPSSKVPKYTPTAPPYSPTVVDTSSTIEDPLTPGPKRLDHVSHQLTGIASQHTSPSALSAASTSRLQDSPTVTKSPFDSTLRHCSNDWLELAITTKAEALVNELLPPITYDALQQNMEEFLNQVEDGHRRAENEFDETVDEAKTEVHSARDESIKEIEGVAQESLADFQDDIEAMMISFTGDLEEKAAELKQQLEQQVEQKLKQQLNLHWRLLRKAFNERNGTVHQSLSRTPAPSPPRTTERSTSASADAPAEINGNITCLGLAKVISEYISGFSTTICADSARHDERSGASKRSATSAAAQLLLSDFSHLHPTAKATALDTFTEEKKAEVFLMADEEVRKALINRWTEGVIRSE